MFKPTPTPFPNDNARRCAAASTATTSRSLNALAAYLEHASMGDRAALARIDQHQPLRPHEIAALARALLAADVAPEKLQPSEWQRWALIAHGMAIAGHNAKGKLGQQLAKAQVAESRVSQLLAARGAALTALLPRVLRLLARKGVHPNWTELGTLILKESCRACDDMQQTELIRLQIAGAYFPQKIRKKVAEGLSGQR